MPPSEILRIEPAWAAFIARQAAGCIERHRRQGLPEHLLSDLGRLLADVPKVVPLDAPPVILTGEWIPENLLLADAGDGWELAAVFDFGDVMTGWREYDLLGPSTFMCGGRPNRMRSLLTGYGAAPGDCDAAMRRLRIDDWQGRIGSLLDLEEVIWPL